MLRQPPPRKEAQFRPTLPLRLDTPVSSGHAIQPSLLRVQRFCELQRVNVMAPALNALYRCETQLPRPTEMAYVAPDIYLYFLSMAGAESLVLFITWIKTVNQLRMTRKLGIPSFSLATCMIQNGKTMSVIIDIFVSLMLSKLGRGYRECILYVRLPISLLAYPYLF